MQKPAGPSRAHAGIFAYAPVRLTLTFTGTALTSFDASGVTDGDVVSVDVRGRGLECEVVKPPFVAVKTR